jgi:hypothetical protein
MKNKLSILAVLILLMTVLGVGASTAFGLGSSGSGPLLPALQLFDNPTFCSNWLQHHGDNSLPPELLEQCVQAIATTYIDGEQNSIPPQDILFATDVSRHQLGTPADFQPGNAAALVQGYVNGSTATILSITDREWVVEGDVAWINYTGYLKCNPNVPGFYVGEKITVQNGLIHEILIAGVVVPSGVCSTS